MTLDLVAGWQGDPSFRGDAKTHIATLRLCPNPDCRAVLFCLYYMDIAGLHIEAVFPAEQIDFDASGLPDPVLAAVEEAVACHAHGYWVAAAMMVRKTLEEVCRDKGAEGGNLMSRITALRERVILPPALFHSLDALRLLSNDAAHVESRAYEQVGREEVEIALEITKRDPQVDLPA